MKGICHIWSRGRLISPSLPFGDDWYLNLGSQKRSPGRNLGEHRSVRRFGTASRGTALLVYCLRMHSFPRIEVHTISMGKISAQGQLNISCLRHLLVPAKFIKLVHLNQWFDPGNQKKLCSVLSQKLLCLILFFFFFYIIKLIVFVKKESRLIIGAQPKAGTGHKMQAISFFPGYIVRDISLT